MKEIKKSKKEKQTHKRETNRKKYIYKKSINQTRGNN